MKKVSVIIPCFNATKYLPKCFMSLVQQTIGIGQIELICLYRRRFYLEHAAGI